MKLIKLAPAFAMLFLSNYGHAQTTNEPVNATVNSVPQIELRPIQSGQTLTLKIIGIKKRTGNIFVSICRKEQFLKSKCSYAKGVRMVNLRDNKIDFENVEVGQYAVQMFHDVNGDMKLGKNFMGIPIEPYAFSNKAMGKFGPPKFEDAAIDFKATSEFTINLQ